jgi:hypothetical protein
MPLNLPPRPSHEFLKKLAKERLGALRAADPRTKLATAQFAIAREYGFASWRALKAEVDQRRAPNIAEFIRACTAGDVDAIAGLLAKEPSLARERVATGKTCTRAASSDGRHVRTTSRSSHGWLNAARVITSFRR